MAKQKNINKDINSLRQKSLYESLLSSITNEDKVAYYYQDKKVTYGKLITLIDKCAKSLKKLHVMPNDIVSVIAPKEETLIMVYALNKIGAVANLIDPMQSIKELEKILEANKSKVVVIKQSIYPKILAILDSVKIQTIILASDEKPHLKDLAPITKVKRIALRIFDNVNVISWKKFLDYSKLVKENQVVQTSNDAIIFSNNDRNIVLTSYNINSSCIDTSEILKDLTSEDLLLNIFPINRSIFFSTCIHLALLKGLSIILANEELLDIEKLIKEYSPTILVLPESILLELINKKTSRSLLKKVKLIICLNNFITKKEKRQIDKALKDKGSNVKLLTGYYQDETTSFLTLTTARRYKNNTIGTFLPNTKYKIVQPSMHESLEAKKEGQLCVSGPTIMKYYYNNPKKTYQTLRYHPDGKLWFHTQDICTMEEDGTITYNMTTKNILPYSIYNIDIDYINEIIGKHKAIYTSIVITKKDNINTPYLKAYIILKNNYQDNTKLRHSIYKYCLDNLPEYSIPKEFEFIKALQDIPKNN